MKRIIKSVSLLLTLFILAHIVLGEDGATGGNNEELTEEEKKIEAEIKEKERVEKLEKYYAEKRVNNTGDAYPTKPYFTLENYSKKVESALQCYTSQKNFCDW